MLKTTWRVGADKVSASPFLALFRTNQELTHLKKGTARSFDGAS